MDFYWLSCDSLLASSDSLLTLFWLSTDCQILSRLECSIQSRAFNHSFDQIGTLKPKCGWMDGTGSLNWVTTRAPLGGAKNLVALAKSISGYLCITDVKLIEPSFQNLSSELLKTLSFPSDSRSQSQPKLLEWDCQSFLHSLETRRCLILRIFQLGRMGDLAAGGAFRKFPGAEDPFDSEVEVENCWVKIYQETIHQCGAKSPGGDAIGSEVRATDTTNNLPSPPC